VPDVSADADEITGAITAYSTEFEAPPAPDGWITLGGTSSSAQIWAAMLADINASPTCKANPATKNGVGFASPLLYAVASNPVAYAASFNDITTGNNDIDGLDDGLLYPATKGYDLASGLGSPQLTGTGGTDGLACYLCGLADAPRAVSVSGIARRRCPSAAGR
jgi:subtilase family serine protease